MKRFLRVLGLSLLQGLFAAAVVYAQQNPLPVVVAYDLDSATFTYCTTDTLSVQTCGTAADSGWFRVGQFTNQPGGSVIMVAEVNQANTTSGIDFRWECSVAGSSSLPLQVCPTTNGTVTTVLNAAAGIGGRYACVVDFPMDRCRIGMKLTSTDDGNDLTTNAESISMYVLGR